MNKKDFDLNAIENELKGASLFFPTDEKKDTPRQPKIEKNRTISQEAVSSSAELSEPIPVEKERYGKKEGYSEGRKEGRKFTSKLVNISSDPPVNKVGYYFTRREIDQLDTLVTKLKPILRDKYNLKISKNEIIRACFAIGLVDWEENQLSSELVYLLTSK